MAIRGNSITITYTAWNTSTNAPQTLDAANHTIKLVKDGTEATATNTPTEVDATNAKGEYKLTLTGTEMTCDAITVCGVSSMANVVIIPVKITTEHGVLPNVQQGNAGCVPTIGTGTYQINTDGTGNVKSLLQGILTTLLTETSAGYLAAAFKKFFNIAAPTLTTGGVDQTGDSFPRIGANGSGLTNLAPASTALSNATWTGALATGLTTLAGHDPGGTLASGSSQTSILNAVNAITTNTSRTAIVVPQFVALPPSGSSTVLVKITLYNLQGQLEDADTNTVTVHASDSSGTSHDSQLSATTATRDSAGQYHVTYNLNSTDAEGGIYINATYTVGGTSMAASAVFAVAQADTVTSIAAIKAQTDKLQFDGSNYLKSDPQVDSPGTTTLLGRVTATRAGNLDNLDTAPPTAAQNATAVWTDTTAGDFTTAGSPGYVLMAANAIETGLSFVQAIRGCVAGIFGKIVNAGSNPEVFQNPAGTANRLTVNNDSSGNRTTVTPNL